MKTICTIVLFGLICSCGGEQVPEAEKVNLTKDNKSVVPGFQPIIDSADVQGAILIYDLEENTYYSNDFDWTEKGHLPASTFKIVNSIIALETGVVEDDSTLFEWDGKKRAMQSWEQDLLFREAFHVSCVPCYQEIARKIGTKRMNNYLNDLAYGKMQVDSSNIDVFWLEGNSEISQFQQVDFLKRFYLSELPITDRTEEIMRRLMVIEATDEYTLSGKTGWSIRNGNNNGWFVGYLETKGKVYFFATNVVPKESFNMDMFPKIRKEITYKALREMGLM